MGKVVSIDELVLIRNKAKEEKKSVVFTNGCFDILHLGHIEYLKESAKLGDYLIVAINSDSSVKKLKGESRPIFGEKERAIILSSLEFVDFVVIFEEETPINLIKKLIPDFLVKGGDYSINEVVGREEVEKNGGKVVIIPYLQGYSTTNLLKKIGR